MSAPADTPAPPPADRSAAAGFDRHYADEQIRRRRHPLRRWVKSFYLRNILADVRGPTIDFGCGAGQLLERLPAGSVGLELNPHLLEFLRGLGLEAWPSDGSNDAFALRTLPARTFRTLVIAHVLEHLDDPPQALATLMAAARRLGVERVIVVVPGIKGFASDATHRTFIDRAFAETRLADLGQGYRLRSLAYFPGPWAWIGRTFVFHEMKLVFDSPSAG